MPGYIRSDLGLEGRKEDPRKCLSLQGFLFSEDDGTRTRNHRIDSPLMTLTKPQKTQW